MVVENNKISFRLDSRIFSKNGIMKCVYWYSDEFQIDITFVDEFFFKIEFTSNKDLSKENLNKIGRKVNQEFIDYNLRDIVKNETNTIRELIIAKAFSNGEFDEDPKGNLVDPIGIKVL